MIGRIALDKTLYKVNGCGMRRIIGTKSLDFKKIYKCEVSPNKSNKSNKS